MTPYKVQVTSYGEGTIYIEHSFDTEFWTEAALNAASAQSILIECPNGEEVYIRGSDKNEGTFHIGTDAVSDAESGVKIQFLKYSEASETPQLKISGNLASLINYKWVNNSDVRNQELEEYYNNDVSNISFNKLFQKDSANESDPDLLVDASELYLDINDKAYHCLAMFDGCKALTSPPKLTATSLSDSCYSDMFKDCTALVQMPTLPASTLANSCYNNMFSGCTSLNQLSDLSATELVNNCYSGMFSDCIAITSAPELPATTLAEGCYQGMFSGTAIQSTPDLNAENLATDCYKDMFSGCTSLTDVSDLPATTLAEGCYQGMFNGCTSLDKTPKLPAKTLASYCYQNMFKDCTSLQYPPLLQATQLASGCYQNMFQNIEQNIISKTQTEVFEYPYNFPEDVLNELNISNFIFSNDIIDTSTINYFIKLNYYNSWNDIEAFNKTWDDWKALNLSWDEFIVYKEQ